jgi:glycosyltransferase involved in cell wall biosynthesis
MKLTVLIPCYNERDTIAACLERVVAAVPAVAKEIIIVDDCSRDGTRDLLRTEIAPLVTKIIYHEVNQGKGAALRTGLEVLIGESAYSFRSSLSCKLGKITFLGMIRFLNRIA